MTTKAEAAALLAIAAAFDNRTVTEAAAVAWSEALDRRITLEDGKRIIIEHYARTRDWIMPADINQANRLLRKSRTERVEPEPPTTLDPADTLRLIAWRRSWFRHIGDGLTPEAATTAACAELGLAPPPPITATRPVEGLIAATAASTRTPRPASDRSGASASPQEES